MQIIMQFSVYYETDTQCSYFLFPCYVKFIFGQITWPHVHGDSDNREKGMFWNQ